MSRLSNPKKKKCICCGEEFLDKSGNRSFCYKEDCKKTHIMTHQMHDKTYINLWNKVYRNKIPKSKIEEYRKARRKLTEKQRKMPVEELLKQVGYYDDKVNKND